MNGLAELTALSSFNLLNNRFFQLLSIVSGGLGESRGPNNTEPAHQAGHTQFSCFCHPRQPANVAVANPPTQGNRSRLLHVSNQHKRHEGTAGLHRRFR